MIDRITRRGLPLMLAYAITVHRCQGMTIRKGILDLEKREFCAGLTFTALSRFASLFHFLIESTCLYEKRFEGLRSFQMMYRIAEDARLLWLSEPENEEYDEACKLAKLVANQCKKSTILWRIPGNNRLKDPNISLSSKSRLPGKKDGEDIEDVDVDDETYEIKMSNKAARGNARVTKRQTEQAARALEITAIMASNKLIIDVPNVPRLGTELVDYRAKRWCLRAESEHYIQDLKLLIATHRRQGTSTNEMFFDNFSINFVTYHYMEVFFCNGYLYGTSIDYFLSLSLRHKASSVHARFANEDIIPGLVNDHSRQLTDKIVTYLPTSFYEILAGNSTNVISNDYNYARVVTADYTSNCF